MIKFQDQLKLKIDEYVKCVYKASRDFPKEELYGVTSQLRRATMSVMLNYLEGYARFKNNVKLNFYEISYGSLKESRYLVYFSHCEKYLNEDTYKYLIELSDEIGKMLWRSMEPLR